MSNPDAGAGGTSTGFIDTQKRMADRKSLQEFVSQIQNNKEAYALFFEQAEKRGMMQASPQRRF
jgi:hypothetical protein